MSSPGRLRDTCAVLFFAWRLDPPARVHRRLRECWKMVDLGDLNSYDDSPLDGQPYNPHNFFKIICKKRLEKSKVSQTRPHLTLVFGIFLKKLRGCPRGSPPQRTVRPMTVWCC